MRFFGGVWECCGYGDSVCWAEVLVENLAVARLGLQPRDFVRPSQTSLPNTHVDTNFSPRQNPFNKDIPTLSACILRIHEKENPVGSFLGTYNTLGGTEVKLSRPFTVPSVQDRDFKNATHRTMPSFCLDLVPEITSHREVPAHAPLLVFDTSLKVSELETCYVRTT